VDIDVDFPILQVLKVIKLGIGGDDTI
jgi:hypothetical protein